MRKAGVFVYSLFAVVGLAGACPADEPKGEAKPQVELVGTWKLISARYGGQEHRFPAGTTTLKHVTPTQFMWATYDADGKVTRAAGGGYTLAGEDYEETPEYGLSQDFEVIRGKPQSFRCKVEGSRWHHEGKLSNGLTIDEVWERVERK
jgi:hypothetical protein